MPINPLPQFEADLEEDRKIYERLKPPTSIVVRFGIMKLVGEFPYSGDAKPGCGSKFVVRTHRGTELAEMLTSTCPNAGCSKSVTRKEMLEYIDNSGGRDYPFFNQGRVLRLATAEDLARQATIDASRTQLARSANAIARAMNLPMKIVDAEPLLGGERLTFYFTSEDRIDFRDLVNQLAAEHHTRIEMRQVGARDEARLVADYEKCGQHCCCKQFLKVLKPISMKSAKIQKATLDPLKISGRCGRLMCCLRYEDETYDELRARLPKKKTRVKTPDGWGTVLDTQILTQLALVRLDSNGEDIAVPIENFIKDGETPPPPPPPPGFGPDGPRAQGPRRAGPGGPPPRPAGSGHGRPGPAPREGDPAQEGQGERPPRERRDRRDQRPTQQQPQHRDQSQGRPPRDRGENDRNRGPRPPRPAQQQQPRETPGPDGATPSDADFELDDGINELAGPDAPDTGAPGAEPALGPDGQPRRKRRRRRRRRGGGGGGGPASNGGAPDAGGGGGAPSSGPPSAE